MTKSHVSRDEAWQAMKRGDYEIAFRLYGEKAAARPRSVAQLNNQASAALSLKRYEEARNILAGVQREYDKVQGPFSGRTRLSVATWLCGSRTDAIDTLKAEITAIDNGKTGYLDNGFGINEGEILLYFGASSDDQSTMDAARSYLERRKLKPLGKSWPPGLLGYLLDEISEDETRELISNQAVTPDASEEARSILTPRAIMQFDFCRALKARERGERLAAQSVYADIARRPNLILVEEWYLAVEEAGL